MSTVLPLESRSQHDSQPHLRATENPDWVRIGVGASLLTGALLLIAGKRKAGLLLTATGTALAMLENRDLVGAWWESLPQHLDRAQQILDQTQHTIEDLSAKRDKIMEMFGR